jgi:hypothetical protein
MRSSVTLGLLFFVMGGLGLQPSLSPVFSLGQRPGAIAYLIAGLLIVSGLLLIAFRRPIAFYVALFAAVATVVTGLVSYSGHPQLALPVPPVLSIVIGLYLCVRLAIARNLYFASRRSESWQKA